MHHTTNLFAFQSTANDYPQILLVMNEYWHVQHSSQNYFIPSWDKKVPFKMLTNVNLPPRSKVSFKSFKLTFKNFLFMATFLLNAMPYWILWILTWWSHWSWLYKAIESEGKIKLSLISLKLFFFCFPVCLSNWN